MSEFKKELKALLDKHNIALVAESAKNKKDFSVRIGFQNINEDFKTEWANRNHLTGYDLDV